MNQFLLCFPLFITAFQFRPWHLILHILTLSQYQVVIYKLKRNAKHKKKNKQNKRKEKEKYKMSTEHLKCCQWMKM